MIVETPNGELYEIDQSILEESIHIPNGEDLIRNLGTGEYEICGIPFNVVCRGYRTDIDRMPYNPDDVSYIDGAGTWVWQAGFEVHIGKRAKYVQAHEIKKLT